MQNNNLICRLVDIYDKVVEISKKIDAKNPEFCVQIGNEIPVNTNEEEEQS